MLEIITNYGLCGLLVWALLAITWHKDMLAAYRSKNYGGLLIGFALSVLFWPIALLLSHFRHRHEDMSRE